MELSKLSNRKLFPVAETWLNNFTVQGKNQVTFKNAVGEEISGKKPENNVVSQIGIAVPMQGLGNGTARYPMGGGGLDPSCKVG